MARRMQCPTGHLWDTVDTAQATLADAPSGCPICGAKIEDCRESALSQMQTIAVDDAGHRSPASNATHSESTEDKRQRAEDNTMALSSVHIPQPSDQTRQILGATIALDSASVAGPGDATIGLDEPA